MQLTDHELRVCARALRCYDNPKVGAKDADDDNFELDCDMIIAKIDHALNGQPFEISVPHLASHMPTTKSRDQAVIIFNDICKSSANNLNKVRAIQLLLHAVHIRELKLAPLGPKAIRALLRLVADECSDMWRSATPAMYFKYVVPANDQFHYSLLRMIVEDPTFEIQA